MWSTLLLWKSFGLHKDASLMAGPGLSYKGPKSEVKAFRLAQFKPTPFRPPAALSSEVLGE